MSIADVLDKHWSEFSTAWKKVRHGCSDKSVHKLRVSDRRLVSLLEILHALDDSSAICRLQKRFMKILKRFGSLRDLQVQLAETRELESVKEIRSFRKSLKRDEKKETRHILAGLRPGKKDALRSGVRRVRERFQKAAVKRTSKSAPAGVKQLIVDQYSAYTDARKKFEPNDGASLHKMRIALKEFRYTLECALEVFHGDIGEHAEAMQAQQKLMGDLRDNQLLAMRLQRWSEKRGIPAESPVRAIIHDMKLRQGLLTASLVGSQPELL